MHIILIPGLWLDGSTWDRVVPALGAAGHRTTAMTLPGMQSITADRSGITLADHVAAVIDAIDAAEETVLLVAHSAGCGIAHAALDARPDRIAGAVYIGGFPSDDGDVLLEGLEAVDGEVAMPDWVEVGEEANVADLDDAALADLYAGAIPVPEGVLTTPVRLNDPRRHEVPLTMVCPEYRVADLEGWMATGEGPGELAAAATVDYVDLPAGHWPQLTRPDDLARVILAAVPAG